MTTSVTEEDGVATEKSSPDRNFFSKANASVSPTASEQHYSRTQSRSREIKWKSDKRTQKPDYRQALKERSGSQQDRKLNP
uniref:Uncharacterized protein n=1 Tax=Monodelphis domestica TaxID=13616 RepID=A0A5F8GNX5_MONDO